MIDTIHASGGEINAFFSHCGGLVAPESDDNPWRYKISWNPRNVVLAGKNGAVYKLNNETVHDNYEQLFDQNNKITIDELDDYCWYPNRDSLRYLPLYHLHHCATFIRTTLRPAEFCFGWKNIIDLHLTAEDQFYETDGLSIAGFLHQHFERNGFSDWITQQLLSNLSSVGDMLKQTLRLLDKEEEMRKDESGENDGNFLVVDDDGKLKNVNLDEAKLDAAQNMVMRLYENNLLLKQLFFLGMDDNETLINKGKCSAADVLLFILEQKLPLLPHDRDMVIMQHEIEYEIGENKFLRKATLVLKGEDGVHTAMAKTVGLPLGIAARLILNAKIDLTGVQIPIAKEIYEPVLRELAAAGIEFVEKTEIV
jgi:saccharopine dehydrogenase-like NADP-dependent oxidoreductase